MSSNGDELEKLLIKIQTLIETSAISDSNTLALLSEFVTYAALNLYIEAVKGEYAAQLEALRNRFDDINARFTHSDERYLTSLSSNTNLITANQMAIAQNEETIKQLVQIISGEETFGSPSIVSRLHNGEINMRDFNTRLFQLETNVNKRLMETNSTVNENTEQVHASLDMIQMIKRDLELSNQIYLAIIGFLIRWQGRIVRWSKYLYGKYKSLINLIAENLIVKIIVSLLTALGAALIGPEVIDLIRQVIRALLNP